MDLTSVGRFEPQDERDTVVAEEDAVGGRYRKLVVSDGKLVGAILVGHSAEAQAIVEAVKEQREVSASDGRLLGGDWSLPAVTETPVRKVA